MRFWKLQSVGNDFPLIHLDDLKEPDGGPSIDFQLAELAVRMCDRKFGVGGDGLLAVRMERAASSGGALAGKRDDDLDSLSSLSERRGFDQDPASQQAVTPPASPREEVVPASVLRLRMFNPDGTEDFCGNGIRCAALHAHTVGWVSSRFSVRHLEEEIPTEIDFDGVIRTTLPPASYDPDKVPVAERRIFNDNVWSGMDSGMPLSLFGSALSTGSTHVIIPTAELPDDETFLSVSPKIENDPKFPQRTSVIWVKEIGPMRLNIRIWERGVGETMGCGTGSSAAAVDYLRRKSIGGTVEVENPGGLIKVTADSWEGKILVEAAAQEVFSGSWRV